MAPRPWVQSDDQHMAKQPSRPRSKKTSQGSRSRPTSGGPAAPAPPTPGDPLAEKAAGTQALSAACRSTPARAAEYDPDAALAPPRGEPTKAPDPMVGASTVSGTARIRQGWEAVGPSSGRTLTAGPLDRVRVDSTGRVLTTNQGVPVGDNQSSLKAGLRGPTLLEDFILREKITHFDHERIPERIVHARGSAAHGCVRVHAGDSRIHPGVPVCRGRQADTGLRPVLDRARRARFDRHGPRRAWLRREVLHRRRQLGPGRQQHSGVLHPGRDEVSRPGARRQAGAAPRDAAGRVGARHVLGLCLADARNHPHADVGDVGSSDPAQLPDDAGLRRPYLPLRQRRWRVELRQVPLEPARRDALAGLGRSRQDLGRRSRLPSPRSVGGHRIRRLSGVGARRCRSSPKSRPTPSPSTSSTPPRSSPRSWCRSCRSAGWC